MSKDTSDKDCCGLCGGTVEVQITPYGQADSHADVFGCPACIQADRDEAERERDELQQQLATERASLFAESQRKQQLEQQVCALLGALELLLCDVEEAEYMTGREREAEARAVIQKVRGAEC